MRYYPPGFLFDVAGCSIFSDDQESLKFILGYANTVMVKTFLASISPTLNFEAGQVASLPILKIDDKDSTDLVNTLIKESKDDWDSLEISWDFRELPILKDKVKRYTIQESYNILQQKWYSKTIRLKSLEEENNLIFIQGYKLQDELKPNVSIDEITLTCNPHYRYGNNKTDEAYRALLMADTMKEFISYSVGCMFGRYSLEKQGLILANQGEVLEDYLAKIPAPTFKPDDDNVIPIMDVDWFTDDIAERFKKFLKVTFGEEHYTENLEFIEDAIGKDIRKFFLKEFYTYHVKMYKKRPIYWMFSSPKGSFNALIYMHRYKPDTVSIVLNDYLREFRTKLAARKDNLENISISASASQGEKTKALKEIENIKKVLDEVDGYERDILYPLATKQIEIDLDDGVKVNYPKFGKALKKITGLSKK